MKKSIQKQKLIQMIKTSPTLSESKEICPRCEDTFWIRDNKGIAICECQTGITPLPKSNTLETFQPRNDNQKTSRDFAKEFLYKEIKDLVIIGGYQSGKTSLCNAISNSLQLQGTPDRSIVQVSTAQFNSDLKWNREIGETALKVDQNIRYYKNIPYLLFELDYRPSMLNDSFKDQLSEVISARAKNKDRKTILTVPYLEQLQKVSKQIYQIVINKFQVVTMDN